MPLYEDGNAGEYPRVPGERVARGGDWWANTQGCGAVNYKYGQYKVLVNYTNGQQSDSFLNNFFVTYGLIGEEIEFNTDVNTLQFGTGRDLEYYSLAVPYKNYIIYTSDKTGTISFLQTKQSIYSDKNMSIPDITYNISSNNIDSYTYTITSNSGYDLDYKFNIEYFEE